MRKNIFEAKADLESGIAKSLSGDVLNSAELEELLNLSQTDLISDHDLDHSLSSLVINHVQMEKSRIANQEQIVRSHLEESIRDRIRSNRVSRNSIKEHIDDITDFSNIY